MAKKRYDESEGIWRTIGGRRVFIKTGQSLSDAMKESGKFNKTSDVKRGEYQETRTELEDIRESDKLKTMWRTTETEGKPTPKKILKQTEKVNEIRSELHFRQRGRYDNEGDYSGNISDLKGKHIARDNFYTRQDGTKEYDPYKGTRFEKKYDSMDDVIKDPNSALNQYITNEGNNKSISTLYDVYEDEDGYRGKGKELLKFIEAEEKDSGITISNSMKNKLRKNPDKEFIFDNNEEKVFDVSNKDVSPMSEWSDTKGDGLSDLQRKVLSEKYTADEEDILDRYSEDYGYEGKDKLSNLKGQIDYMRNPGESINTTAQRLVEGGDFLVWNGDVQNWLRERNIKFNEDNYFDVYKKEMADKIENLYNRATTSNLRVRFKGTIAELKKNTNMSEQEILEMLKKRVK